MMFARLDFPRFLVCCSGDLSDNESEEKPSVAICGGSICILTGLWGRSVNLITTVRWLRSSHLLFAAYAAECQQKMKEDRR